MQGAEDVGSRWARKTPARRACGAVCAFRFSSFFFSSRRRHTRSKRDWSSDVCSSDLSIDEMTNYVNANSSCLGIATTSSVQFGSAAFPSIEGDGQVNITVTRAGDTSGAASVNYATSDLEIGRASCRERV